MRYVWYIIECLSYLCIEQVHKLSRTSFTFNYIMTKFVLAMLQMIMVIESIESCLHNSLLMYIIVTLSIMYVHN